MFSRVAPQYAATNRPDGHLRARRILRWQSASRRSRARYAVQHIHARRPAADADRAAGQRVARGGRRSGTQDALFFVATGRGDGSHSFRRRSRSTSGGSRLPPAPRNEALSSAADSLRWREARVSASRPISRSGGASGRTRYRRRHDARARRHAAWREEPLLDPRGGDGHCPHP